jgi:hypothetical protein
MNSLDFNPTPEMIRANDELLLAKSKVAALKPIVMWYKSEILAEGKWSRCKDMAGLFGDELVLDPLDVYLMSEEDQAAFQMQCNAARDNFGPSFAVEPPFQCPLIAAEDSVVKAQHALIKAMEVHGKKSVDALLLLGIDAYKEYVQECSQLLAPYVKDSLLCNDKLGRASPSLSSMGMVQLPSRRKVVS